MQRSRESYSRTSRDTVSSVGAIVSRHFPYATASETIRVFRQAISLDEHRVKVHSIPSERSSELVELKSCDSSAKTDGTLLLRVVRRES